MKSVVIALGSALFFACVCNAAGPSVLVKHKDKYQGFMQQPRLAEVVTGFNQSADFYWPAARFYQTNPADITQLEQQRKHLLLQLQQLQQVYAQERQTELEASTAELSQDITNWPLAKQLLLPLDPDRVRIKPELNPKLVPGQYELIVGPRPAVIQVSGLAKTKTLPLLNAATAANYAEQLKLLDGASTSFIYVIPAGQTAFVAQIGLWNSERQDIPAGAVLFVPFEERVLPAEFTDLNKQIAELIQHKVVL